jgi:hypothetical protein
MAFCTFLISVYHNTRTPQKEMAAVMAPAAEASAVYRSTESYES